MEEGAFSFRAAPAAEAGPATTATTDDWASASTGAEARDWVRGRLLGSGSFGQVHSAVCASGALFAVKSAAVLADAAGPRSTVTLRALENEIQMLSSLRDCPEVVGFLGSSWTREADPSAAASANASGAPPAPLFCRNLHLELAPGGSVAGLLRDSGAQGLPEPLLQRYTCDVTRALRHLHARGIVHGDVKGLNILITNSGAKLADFGTAWYTSSSPSAEQRDGPGTPRNSKPAGAEPGRATEAAQGASAGPGRSTSGAPQSFPRGESSFLPRLLAAAHGVPEGCRSSPGLEAPRRSSGARAPGKDHSSLEGVPYSHCPPPTSQQQQQKQRQGQAQQEKGQDGSAFRREQRRELRGSPYWMSPETVRERPTQGSAVDVWSLGCTVLEMATGKAPWGEVRGGLCAVLYAIGCTDGLPLVPAALAPAVRDFIGCCLRRNPEERWTAAELLAHPFLTEAAGAVPTPPHALQACASVPHFSSHEGRKPVGGTHAPPHQQQQQQQGSAVLPCAYRRTNSCSAKPEAAAGPCLEASHKSPSASVSCCLTDGCSSVGASLSPSLSPSSRAGSRRRGFSPLGCLVLEKAQASRPEGARSPSGAGVGSPKRKRDEEDTMTSSFPLLDLSWLKERLPASAGGGGSLQDGESSPIWPNSPLSQQGAGWVVVHSPKRAAHRQ